MALHAKEAPTVRKALISNGRRLPNLETSTGVLPSEPEHTVLTFRYLDIFVFAVLVLQP